MPKLILPKGGDGSGVCDRYLTFESIAPICAFEATPARDPDGPN